MTLWLELVVAALVLGGLWYLLSTAGRLDRLHRRVEGARSALDNQLLRRATAASDLAGSGVLDPASSVLLAGAAHEAVAAGEERAALLASDPLSRFRMADRDAALEVAESDLSRVLRLVLRDAPERPRESPDDDVLDELRVLAAACHRVSLARRFHNDAATQAVRLRRKRLVRWARLAGSAVIPRTVEIDDEPPAALAALVLPSAA